MAIETVNPATGESIETYPEMSWPDVEKLIDQSHAAYLQWRRTEFDERADKMRAAAKLLRDDNQRYAEMITREMGKPITQALGEIEKCALVCEHYADHAAEYLAPRHIEAGFKKSYVSYQPTGAVFAIMPWNFPFWQVFRFAAPTLMAGNVALLKHAPISTGAALMIEAIFKQVGFPDGAFTTLIIGVDEATKVIEHPKIVAVTLTGSERAGGSVGATAGNALKHVVLELGGCDPYLILEDADLDLAADQVIKSRLSNTGQVCISAKRLIVVDDVFDAFQEKVMQKVAEYKMGDPMDPQCNFGPMARSDLRDELHQQVQSTISAGATCLLGGQMPDGPGYYYPPTVLTNVAEGMVAYDQELFGPVVAFIRVKDEAEAIQVANNTRFGLASAVFTQDLERGEHLAEKCIEAGACSVNQLVASNPLLPFGGIKSSGYGRELSAEGIRAFTNAKTVVVA